MEKIGAEPAEPNVEWLYAMAYAYWRLGDTAQEDAGVKRMVRTFPESAMTGDALNYYLFRATGERKERGRPWERELAIAHPDSPQARSALIISFLCRC